MWICFNDAFISIVQDETGLMKVRARKKKHLGELFPSAQVFTTKDSDYAHRVFVDRAEVAAVVTRAIMAFPDCQNAVTYDNFKDSVQDKALHDLYMDFWLSHHDYQNGRGPVHGRN